MILPDATDWRPPSSNLKLHNGLWQVRSLSPISYPEAGNDLCFQVEDGSFWFQHRLGCIRTLLAHYPPGGTLFDIGGGNGYVAAALQSTGMEVALVEPGSGACNALRRGVRNVIRATLEEAQFHPHSLPAATAFDVVEHIENDCTFLRNIRDALIPNGRFYCTVPAGQYLWSEEDIHAGHFRRYNRQTLCTLLAEAGFNIEFVSPLFAWLTIPVYLFRTLPSLLHINRRKNQISSTNIRADHSLPGFLQSTIKRAHAWELARLRERNPLPFGTSLFCVARAK